MRFEKNRSCNFWCVYMCYPGLLPCIIFSFKQCALTQFNNPGLNSSSIGTNWIRSYRMNRVLIFSIFLSEYECRSNYLRIHMQNKWFGFGYVFKYTDILLLIVWKEKQNYTSRYRRIIHRRKHNNTWWSCGLKVTHQ